MIRELATALVGAVATMEFQTLLHAHACTVFWQANEPSLQVMGTRAMMVAVLTLPTEGIRMLLFCWC